MCNKNMLQKYINDSTFADVFTFLTEINEWYLVAHLLCALPPSEVVTISLTA